MIPDICSGGYAALGANLSKTFHLYESHDEPQRTDGTKSNCMSSFSAQERVEAPEAREQPAGLRIRYQPFGIPSDAALEEEQAESKQLEDHAEQSTEAQMDIDTTPVKPLDGLNDSTERSGHLQPIENNSQPNTERKKKKKKHKLEDEI